MACLPWGAILFPEIPLLCHQKDTSQGFWVRPLTSYTPGKH